MMNDEAPCPKYNYFFPLPAPVHQRPHRHARAVCQLLFRHCFHKLYTYGLQTIYLAHVNYRFTPCKRHVYDMKVALLRCVNAVSMKSKRRFRKDIVYHY